MTSDKVRELRRMIEIADNPALARSTMVRPGPRRLEGLPPRYPERIIYQREHWGWAALVIAIIAILIIAIFIQAGHP